MMTCFSVKSHSRHGMRLSTIMRPFRTQESSPDMARRAARAVCPAAGVHDGREERVLANDTAEGFVQRMRAACPSFDGDVPLNQLRFWFPKSYRTSGRNQPSPEDPGGIDESIDLSRDR